MAVTILLKVEITTDRTKVQMRQGLLPTSKEGKIEDTKGEEVLMMEETTKVLNKMEERLLQVCHLRIVYHQELGSKISSTATTSWVQKETMTETMAVARTLDLDKAATETRITTNRGVKEITSQELMVSITHRMLNFLRMIFIGRVVVKRLKLWLIENGISTESHFVGDKSQWARMITNGETLTEVNNEETTKDTLLNVNNGTNQEGKDEILVLRITHLAKIFTVHHNKNQRSFKILFRQNYWEVLWKSACNQAKRKPRCMIWSFSSRRDTESEIPELERERYALKEHQHLVWV
jgi:hypothetical protein